jgi:hypothetical protein
VYQVGRFRIRQLGKATAIFSILRPRQVLY